MIFERKHFPYKKRLHDTFFKSLIFLVLAAIFASAATPASAQASNSGLLMEARAAFEGYFKYGEWLPVWVELENNGPDLSGEIQVRVAGSQGSMLFVRSIDLPTVSRKQVPIFVLPNNYSRELEVRLFSGGQVVASQKVQVKPQPNISFFVGIIAANRGALALINGISLPGTERPLNLIDVTLSDLPERFEGLRSFDCLVLNDVDTSSLTPEQATAIENWVKQGGRLVIGGGAGALQTVAGLPKEFLPLIPDGQTTLDELPELEKFAALGSDAPAGLKVRVPGPFLAATGAPQSSNLLITQGDVPLLSERSIEKGYVNFVALDLSTSPFEGWSGTTNFWENLFGSTATYPLWMPPDISARQQIASQMPYALSNLPMLSLPSTQGLAALLGVYILLVGPVNYLVLRYKKRLHWAWVTIPAITIIFSAGAFGLGYALHGDDIFLNKIAVIQLSEDGSATVNSFVGLFSPGQESYKIEAFGGGLISPLSPFYNPWESVVDPTYPMSGQEITLEQGDPGYVRGLSMAQWSMQGFMVEGLILDFGQIENDLMLEGQALIGTLHNTTSYALKDVAIVLNRHFVRLGELPAGAEVKVNMPLTDLASQDFGPPISYRLFEEELNQPSPSGPAREAEVKRSILEGILERGIPFKSSIRSKSDNSPLVSSSQTFILLGWLDAAPPSVTVSGKSPAQQTTAVVVMPLSYRLPEKGLTEIPVGMVPGTVSVVPLDGGVCGEAGSTSLYLYRGEGILEFTLPVMMEGFQVDSLKLSVSTDSGWFGEPKIALFDWQAETWVDLKGIVQGINLIPDASNLVSPSGVVKIRLTADEANQGCYYLALGLEGKSQ